MEIIPKVAPKLPPWQNILFYISLITLLVVFLGYFVLDYFLNNASKALEGLEETLTQEKTSSEVVLEEKVFGYQKKITDFSKLIDEHLFTSNFLTFLEETCHPKVKFSQLSLDAAENKAVLLGEAENFSALGQQITIFKKEPVVENVSLSNILIGKMGKVDFDLKLFLQPQLFSSNE